VGWVVGVWVKAFVSKEGADSSMYRRRSWVCPAVAASSDVAGVVEGQVGQGHPGPLLWAAHRGQGAPAGPLQI